MNKKKSKKKNVSKKINRVKKTKKLQAKKINKNEEEEEEIKEIKLEETDEEMEKREKEETKAKKGKIRWQTLRGMRDILPEEWRYWDYFLTRAEKLAESYGFERIETPILEEAALYERSTGASSDIIRKQMYSFRDKSGTPIALRPEITPSIARAYIEKGLFNRPQPVKFFYFGPNFRYERPQAGRYRQFYQFGLEILGSNEPISDAELIVFAKVLLETLGIKPFFYINSLGCSECREIYRKKIIKFLKGKRRQLCPDCQRRYRENPLRVLDCKNSRCQNILSVVPQFVNSLCPNCHEHFIEVLEYLDAANVSREINSYLVRGLDYYTNTVFEFFPAPKDKNDPALEIMGQMVPALGGGGRYNNLIKSFSGRDVPALGLSFGVDRIIEELKANHIPLPRGKKPVVFLAQIGKKARRQCLPLFETLRINDIKCAMNLAKESLKTQLEQADNLGVRFALILGSQEVQDETIIVRNMISGVQEHIPQNKLISYLKTTLR